LAVSLIIAGALTLGQGSPPADNITPGPADSPYLAEASFVLQNYGTLSAEAMSLWRDMTLDHIVSLGVPFCRYNRYYTRFFLQQGETAEITLESNVPMGILLGEDIEGISVMLIAGNAPFDQSNANIYLPQTERSNGGYFTRLERAGGNWTVSWAMYTLGSDYYWLILTNTARQDAWCHFTVKVPPVKPTAEPRS